MLLAESKGHEIVLAGNLASPAAALLAVIAEKYRPNNAPRRHNELTGILARLPEASTPSAANPLPTSASPATANFRPLTLPLTLR